MRPENRESLEIAPLYAFGPSPREVLVPTIRLWSRPRMAQSFQRVNQLIRVPIP